MTEFIFELGDKISDRITGQTGIITSRSEHLFGCNRYWIEPQELKDGKPVDGRWLDEDSIDLLSSRVVARRRYRTVEVDESAPPRRRMAGGPSNQPASQTGPAIR